MIKEQETCTRFETSSQTVEELLSALVEERRQGVRKKKTFSEGLVEIINRASSCESDRSGLSSSAAIVVSRRAISFFLIQCCPGLDACSISRKTRFPAERPSLFYNFQSQKLELVNLRVSYRMRRIENSNISLAENATARKYRKLIQNLNEEVARISIEVSSIYFN